jgi:hypothetical protein
MILKNWNVSGMYYYIAGGINETIILLILQSD